MVSLKVKKNHFRSPSQARLWISRQWGSSIYSTRETLDTIDCQVSASYVQGNRILLEEQYKKLSAEHKINCVPVGYVNPETYVIKRKPRVKSRLALSVE